MKFNLSVVVSVEMEFNTATEAIEWLGEHTVFDVLDHGAVVGEDMILDEDGKNVLPTRNPGIGE